MSFQPSNFNLIFIDLTNKPGYWAKALAERLCEKDAVLFYYVTVAGDVHFGVNGEEKGVFFSGVDTRGQLWAMLDIYGNSTAVQFVDPRQNLNNTQRRRHTQQPQGNVGNQQRNSTVLFFEFTFWKLQN